jgi:hypothetical protein
MITTKGTSPSPTLEEQKLNRESDPLPPELASFGRGSDPVRELNKESRPPGTMPQRLSPSLDEQKRPGRQGKGSQRR